MTRHPVVKHGATIPLSNGHDFTIENHSSVFADDCHCQGFHWFCTHTIIEMIRQTLNSTGDPDD